MYDSSMDSPDLTRVRSAHKVWDRLTARRSQEKLSRSGIAVLSTLRTEEILHAEREGYLRESTLEEIETQVCGKPPHYLVGVSTASPFARMSHRVLFGDPAAYTLLTEECVRSAWVGFWSSEPRVQRPEYSVFHEHDARNVRFIASVFASRDDDLRSAMRLPTILRRPALSALVVELTAEVDRRSTAAVRV